MSVLFKYHKKTFWLNIKFKLPNIGRLCLYRHYLQKPDRMGYLCSVHIHSLPQILEVLYPKRVKVFRL